jgi:hypothetical protein
VSAIPGPTPRPSPRAETVSYAAFISYSHAVDGSLAPALQQALHRFAKPWYRLRALRVFRDESTLAVSPGLWSSIEQALAGSRCFILLASPEAAASPWVQREVGYWCREKSPSTLLIVLTGGTVAWRRDGRDLDWAATTALPRSQLENVFAEEPRYIDLSWARRQEHLSLNHPRFRNCVADLAAPLHGRSKDELVGEDVRQHRRTVRLARSVIASLTALALVVGVLALVARSNAEEANRQRDQARVQRDQAISRQLAVLAAADLGDRPDRALLESVQARRTSDTAEARGALLSALQRNSRLVALVPAGAPVSDVAFSPAPGRPVLATGDQAGTVGLWDPRDSSLLSSMAPDHGPVLSVAFSPDGSRLAAGTQDGTVAIWEVRDPSRPRPLPSIDGSGQLTSVAFSVDGRTVAAASDNHMVMLGRVGQAKVLRWLDDEQGREPLFSVAFSPDGRMLVAGGDDGTVAFWAVGDLPRRKPRLIGTPVQARADAVYSVAFSPDGQIVAVGSSSRTVTLWDVRRRAVVQTSRPDRGDVVDVAFGRRGRTLVSGAAEGVTVWDGSGPLLRSDAFPVHHAVERLAVSPDGRQVAVASSGDDVPARTVAIWSTRARSPLMTPLPPLGRSTPASPSAPTGGSWPPGGRTGP